MSNKIFALCGYLLLSVFVSKAQDTLVLNDGTLIKSKVLEITENSLKYKKYSNLNGPVYTVDKKQVLAVHYENGEQETFKAQEQQPVQTQSEEQITQKEVEVPVADNNASLIAKYNEPVLYKGKDSKKPAKYVTYKYGITKESVLSNEDIEISIHWAKDPDQINTYDGGNYGIKVKNKTNKNIYIDLGSCFAIESDGKFRSFYDGTTQKSVNNGNVNGGAVNLGGVASVLGIGGAVGTIASGVTLGKGSQNSLTTTYTNERFVCIPPQGENYVSVYKDIVVNSGRGLFSSETFELLTKGENFETIEGLKRGVVSKKGVRTFSENDSPYKRDYIITYSKDSNFIPFTKIQFSVYLHHIIGVGMVYEDTIKKYISNYNDYMIIDGSDFLLKK